MKMEISIENLSPRIIILSVNGRIDALTAPEMEKVMTGSFTEPKSGCILNLSGVDYMSSAGIRVLVLGSKMAASTGGLFCVSSLQESVRKVLEIVGFLPLLDVFADVDLAKDAAVKKLV
jgi:anti-anti-sigma factor